MEEIKTEVEDIEFVEVDSHNVHRLCTACLSVKRTTFVLDDDTLNQCYMKILTEMQLEGVVTVLQSPRLCWECMAHLKRSVRFREQVQDSYRLLQTMLLKCDKEDLVEFFQSPVCRPAGRLRTCLAFCIDIPPQDVDTQGMTADDDDDDKTALEYLENNIETRPSTFRASALDKQLEGSDARTSKLAKNAKHCVTTTNKPSSSNNDSARELSTFVCDKCFKRFTSKTALERHMATHHIYLHNTVPFQCDANNMETNNIKAEADNFNQQGEGQNDMSCSDSKKNMINTAHTDKNPFSASYVRNHLDENTI